MQDAMLHYIRNAFGVTIKTGKPARRAGAQTLEASNPPCDIYPCAPGGPNDYVYVYTSRANPQHWPRLLEAIGRKDLIGDPRFETREARVKNRSGARPRSSPSSRSKHDKYECMRVIGAAVPAGAVRDTLELLNDPNFEERGDHPDDRSIRTRRVQDGGLARALQWQAGGGEAGAAARPAQRRGAQGLARHDTSTQSRSRCVDDKII